MLPWWFWALLWTVLVLVAVLCAVLSGIRLFRQGMGVMDSLGAASEKLSDEFSQPGTVVEYAPVARRYPHGTAATHANPEKIKKLREKGKLERIEARRVRRVTRRAERGQAQNMHDLGLF